MMTVAYLANQFPSPVEPYVMDEIEELRRRGVEVIAGSVRRRDCRVRLSFAMERESESVDTETVVLQPVPIVLMVQAAWLCLRRWRRIADLLRRVILQGQETFVQRGKALLHTWLGACYALRLENRRRERIHAQHIQTPHIPVQHIPVHHIHVHHGYFGAWIAMVAARLLNVSYSMTLHGSDLLTGKAYLDAKLKNCRFCVTISEYNRRYILEHYSTIEAGKVIVSRLGVDVPEPGRFPAPEIRSSLPGLSTPRSSMLRPTMVQGPELSHSDSRLHLLAVGRLHTVKDHGFLLRACVRLCQRGLNFQCEIAGEGPERCNLERLIQEYGLEERVRLLGHVPREQQDALYQRADVVVLTSRSEGIPLVLMEAMARGKIVVAPTITGIPELVVAERTGFLYEPGSVEDFVTRVLWIYSLVSAGGSAGDFPAVSGANQLNSDRLDHVRLRAREQVRLHFNRKKNLELFADVFLERIFREQILPEQILPARQHSGANRRTA
jgi:glycosyltransferase involved in cell wall biosynthesis